MNIGAVILPTGSFNGALPVVLSDVACVGNENSILNCSGNAITVECDSGEGAAVVCQGEYTFIHILPIQCIYMRAYLLVCSMFLV